MVGWPWLATRHPHSCCPTLPQQNKRKRACSSMGSSWAATSSRACLPAPQRSSVGSRKILLQHPEHLHPLLFPGPRAHRASQLLFPRESSYPFLSLISLKCHRHGWALSYTHGTSNKAGWNWLCPDWDDPGCSSQRPCYCHCQHLSTCTQL